MGRTPEARPMTTLINRYNPTKADLLLVTYSSTARIIGIDSNQIFDFIFGEDGETIIVTLNNWETHRIDKSEYKKDFVKIRRNRGLHLSVTQDLDLPSLYAIKNNQNRHYHLVETYDEEIYCDCKDYENQIEGFGKGCCKHGYAVLKLMGLTTLRDYIKRTESDRLEIEYENWEVRQDYYQAIG